MRIQILLLPSVVVGKVVREPFGLVVDQCDTSAVDAGEWKRFAEECGARSILITPETVDVVDRWTEVPEAEPTEDEVAPSETPSAEAADTGPFIWDTGPFIRLGESANVDPYKIATELRYLLGRGRPPGRPTARQVLTASLWDDDLLTQDPDRVERLADAILNDLDQHGLEIVQRGDNGGYGLTAVSR
ncbi:hypothetical protein [Streptosporangium sp. NPDC004631]